jgi:carbohydrate-selective porin OprB
MAAQGSGSAALIAVALLVALVSLLTNTATAKMTYIVGDDAGWTKNLEASWLNGKTFYAGDVLGMYM